jgi:hypothetical protein
MVFFPNENEEEYYSEYFDDRLSPSACISWQLSQKGRVAVGVALGLLKAQKAVHFSSLCDEIGFSDVVSSKDFEYRGDYKIVLYTDDEQEASTRTSRDFAYLWWTLMTAKGVMHRRKGEAGTLVVRRGL